MEQKINYNLTNPQKSIWYMEEYYKGTAINNICGSLTIDEEVNFEKFEEAINTFVKLNSSFHIRLFKDGITPKQYFCDFKRLDIEQINILSERDIRDIEKQMVNTPINIIEAPLFEFKIFKLPNNHGGFVVNTHHIISDAGTIALIASSIARIYYNLINNIEIDENIPSYLEYIKAEEEYLRSSKFKKDEEYWNSKFKDIPDIASIPSSFKTNSNYTSNSKRELFTLPKDIVDKIHETCLNKKVSVFNFFMAIYSIYLGRVSNCNNFVIGTPILNRTNFKEKNTCGMFISNVPFSISIDNKSNFFDFVSNIAKDSLSLLRHQKYPYQYLLENLRKQNNYISNLYDVVISYQITKAMDKTLDLPYSVHWTGASKISCGINIHLHDNDDSGNLTMAYDYLLDKYSSEDIKQIHSRILFIINQILNNFNISLKDIEIVTNTEKDSFLYQFNDTDTNYPNDKTIIEVFKDNVIKYPDNIAVISENEKLTYKELDSLSNQLANYLIECGYSKDSIISIYLDKDLHYITSILATLKIGATFLPISTSYPVDRINYMIENSTSSLLISNDELYKNLKINCNYFNILSNTETYSKKSIKIKTSSNNLAYILYTSGSTGLPKGVMINNRSIVNHVFSINKNFEYTITHNDNALSIANISFDASIQEIFVPLLTGCTLHLLKNDAIYNIKFLADYIVSNNITFAFIPPSILDDVYSLLKNKNCKLNKLLVGVESINSTILDKFLSLNKDFKIHNGYGPTETTICCTSYMYNHSEKSGIVPIGKPFSNTKILILHPETKRLQPIGSYGEIFVFGDCLAKGYFNNENMTNKSFGNDTFYYNQRYYRTGDFAYYLPNGNIVFVGRLDSQIKLNGHRIELNEINSILSSYKDIKNVVTIVKSKQIITFVTSTTKNVNVSELRVLLSSKLPNYMIPNSIFILDNFPVTKNGKLDLKKLSNYSNQNLSNIVLPSNDTEELLYDYICNLLDKDNISTTDNLLYVGMDSLYAIKLSLYINDIFNVDISVSNIFNSPSIKDISNLILASNKMLKTSVSHCLKSTYYPTSSAQKRIYYVSSASGKNSLSYNISDGIILDRLPDVKKLEYCFKQLIKRHESLRTSFKIVNNELVQVIVDDFEFKLIVNKSKYKNIESCFNNFIKPFNLNEPPLLRAQLIQFDNGKSLLLFNIHHIISDGTSMKILITELCDLYNNKSLTSLDLNYKDFSVWEHDGLNNGLFSQSEKYWTDLFNDEVPVLNLPTNYPRPCTKSYKGKKINLKIDTLLNSKINNICKEYEITPFILLLSVYYILLYKYTMQRDIVIGSPIEGRDNIQFSNIIGMFVNTLPLRMKLDDNLSFYEFLKEVKDLCLNSFKHQSYPLNELVNKLNINRDSSRNPLFDVLFTYQNGGNPNIKLGEIQSQYYEFDSKISKFDLSIEAVPEDTFINLIFEYCTDLFKNDFIEKMTNHFLQILEFIVYNIDAKISDIELLSSKEKQELIYDFNNTYIEYPNNKSLVSLFKEIVEKYPYNKAVQFGKQSITYKELDEKSNTLAIELLQKGVKKGDVIGVCMHKSIELVICIWAILKNSCVYMPMYVGYPKDRLTYMLQNSNCNLVIANSTMQEIIDFPCNLHSIRSFEKIDNTTHFTLPYETFPDDIAYVIYTSGSTGAPKGVQISHKNLNNYIHSFKQLFEGISEKDKLLSSTNISFDVSIWELFFSILNGCTLVLYTEEIINNIISYATDILDYEITILYIPPNILEEVYTMLKNSDCIKIDKLLVGVEPIKKSTLNKYFKLNKNLNIVNGYGPTETTICSTAFKYKLDEENDDIVTIGSPIGNTQIYILDNNMKPVPIGVAGEICIAGDGVGKGYINNDYATKNHFVENTFTKNSLLYKTGDLAKWNDDGTITYLSRIDTQIKLHGYRIELREIDNTILQYPSISKCITVLNKDYEKPYLVTYFTSDKKINTSDLKSYLQTKLTFYMIPSVFIQLDAFPITENGKIFINKLPNPIIKSKSKYSQPKTNIEKELCKIWQELFSIKRIGIDDNFFELGGDSLSAIRFQVEALDKNLNITYADIFSYPTIRLLAKKASNTIRLDVESYENYDFKNINTTLSYNKIENIPEVINSMTIGNILLFGATGFLGSHILYEFLSNENNGIAYCIVRRKDLLNPEERLQKTLQFYFGDALDKYFGKRIKVIVADISSKNFGININDYNNLETKIDIVINSAAIVKHYGDYEKFNLINVIGTQNIIEFCKNFNKKLYHISTTSISGMGIPENSQIKAEKITYFSERNLYNGQNLNNTYIKTKFDAEKIILEEICNGLDASIIRMGNISNRYSDGKFQINVSENAFVNRIKSILKLQVLQEGFLEHDTEFAPVDSCAEAIIKIIESNPKFSVFHIFNDNLISFKNIVQYINELGMSLKFVSDDEFSLKIKKFLQNKNLKNEISGIISDLSPDKTFKLNANILLDSNFTNNYLLKLGFKWPIINKDYITKYIEYFKKINYFN